MGASGDRGRGAQQGALGRGPPLPLATSAAHARPGVSGVGLSPPSLASPFLAPVGAGHVAAEEALMTGTVVGAGCPHREAHAPQNHPPALWPCLSVSLACPGPGASKGWADACPVPSQRPGGGSRRPPSSLTWLGLKGERGRAGGRPGAAAGEGKSVGPVCHSGCRASPPWGGDLVRELSPAETPQFPCFPRPRGAAGSPRCATWLRTVARGDKRPAHQRVGLVLPRLPQAGPALDPQAPALASLGALKHTRAHTHRHVKCGHKPTVCTRAHAS